MNWKQGKWILLAGAAAAAILLSGHPTTPQLARCPEIGRLPGIVLGMVVATTIIHTLVTSIQADLIHSKQLRAWCSTSSSRSHLLIAVGALITAATLFLEILLWAWVYRYVGAIQGLEASLYFSGITFTTVGYGDITLAIAERRRSRERRYCCGMECCPADFSRPADDDLGREH